jgi:predicted nuclease with TOPRIM domain
MAVAHENGVLPDSNPPRLGEILLERGLLSEEQLAYALGEGQRTGEPIGEVIVRLGFAVPATIAQALATQHGGPMKSEYGYAVGFAPPNAIPAAPVAPPPLAPGLGVTSPTDAPGSALRTVPVTPVVEPVEQQQEPVFQAVEPVVQPVEISVQPVEIPAHPVEVVTQPEMAPELDPEVARLQTQVEELAGDLDAARRETRAVAAERSALAIELEASRTRNAELEPVAADAAAARAELERVALESAARIAELDQRLGELDGAAARNSELEASLEAVREQAARNENESAALDAARGAIAVQNAELARRLGELEAEAAEESAARVADLNRINAETSQRSAEAEQRIAQAETRIAELEAERDQLLHAARVSEQPAERVTAEFASCTSHLLFVAHHGGYHLVERDGPPPAAGTTFELGAEDGAVSTYVVSRVGASPLPGRRSACAYVSAV